MIVDEKTFQFIREHENDGVRQLMLQSSRYPDIDVHFAVTQIDARKIARSKIPSWYANPQVLYPKHLSLEQASSEKTAEYKASLCKNGREFVDLTGGLGVDFSFMSRQFEHAVYVEKQRELTELASHNFKAFGLENVEVVNLDAESYLRKMNPVDTIYIDPSRRNKSGSRTVRIEDCVPDLNDIKNLLLNKSEQTIIKLSPMLDISLALDSLDYINAVHVVSVNNECKELLFVRGDDKNTDRSFCCVNLLNDGTIERYTFDRESEKSSQPLYADDVDRYLYEPNASIMKAGGYKSVSLDFSLNKLHTNSHLYTSDHLLESFPGRVFSVKNVFGFSKNDLKKNLRDIPKANVTVRNFPISVDDIRRKTMIKEGGEIYIFATTLADERKVLIVCDKVK
ncbi:MAG: class I SAM-dependent methyltransferase [Dysgonomonas sp.]